MKRPTPHQLDAYLDRVIDRIGHLRELNLAAEGGLHEALEESQNLLANIALYRHLLKNAAQQDASGVYVR